MAYTSMPCVGVYTMFLFLIMPAARFHGDSVLRDFVDKAVRLVYPTAVLAVLVSQFFGLAFAAERAVSTDALEQAVYLFKCFLSCPCQYTYWANPVSVKMILLIPPPSPQVLP